MINEVRKIKAVEHKYDEHFGPHKNVTLGIHINGDDYILGVFICGGAKSGLSGDAGKCEDDIDRIIHAFNKLTEAK